MKVFLLAHQDDEVFLLPHIMDSEQKLFIYLTSGVSEGSPGLKLDRRTTEAKAEGVLHKFVSEENLADIEKVIRNHGAQITQILTTTFEGAHQDHDSAAVISRKLAKTLQVDCIEMSSYPQWFSKFYSFKVLIPHSVDGEFEFVRFRTLVLALKLMVGYKTQRKTWLGLGPATLGAFAFRKYRSSKPAPIAEVHPCFYEFRGRAQQSEVIQCLAKSSKL